MIRIKIGDTWYEPQKGQPVMIEFEEEDKELVFSLPSHCTRLAYWHSDQAKEETNDQRLAWMNEGARKPAKDVHLISQDDGWELTR